MRTMTVLSVVGTRPNFMKTAPVIAELQRRSGRFRSLLVHTGQHYDAAMSTIFFEELGVGEPDHMLGVGSGSHAAQTARVMERLEPVLLEEKPDVVLVPGDVNSTLAAALTASKLRIPIGHIEAGLRSFDRSMPEETNRILTDQMSDLLFIHSPEAEENLLRENVPAHAVHFVGNTMIDSLLAIWDRLDAGAVSERHGTAPGEFLLVTLHRPALVDGPLLTVAIGELEAVGAEVPVIFPAHPRTQARMRDLGIHPETNRNGLRVTDPLGYLEFMSLVAGAAGVLTDSGGIQEETTVLGVPCFTLRDNTERPVTVAEGTNTLLGLDPARIGEIPVLLEQNAHGRDKGVPRGWDGKASERLVDVLEQKLNADEEIKWA